MRCGRVADESGRLLWGGRERDEHHRGAQHRGTDRHEQWPPFAPLRRGGQRGEDQDTEADRGLRFYHRRERGEASGERVPAGRGGDEREQQGEHRQGVDLAPERPGQRERRVERIERDGDEAIA